jgi:hypothetical protein
MFENKFNSKKADPLVEAAKTAMELGQKRRDAIAAVNEEFGVFNRNAVVRENLAAYDARIEQVFNGMKSGNLTEAKLAKKDYDKDGKIESPKDEVWGSRFRAAKKAGKMEEKKDCYEGAMDSDVVGGGAVTKDSKPVVSPTASKVNTSGPSASDKAGLAAKIGAMKEAKLDELKAPTGKTAMAAYRRAERSDDEEGNWSRSNRIYKSMKKRYPGKSARNQKDTGKADLPDVGNIEFHKAGYSGHVTKGGKLTKAASRDTKDGIKSRLGKHTKPHLPEETQIDEVSKGRAISAYRQKEGEGRDTEKLGGLIQRKFGKETAKHAERAGAADTGNLFRRGESHGTDRLASAKSSSDMRKTKSGKIHGQDVKSKKDEIKFRGKMSKFDKKGHLPEETIEEAVSRKHFQQVADLIKGHESQEKRNELASHHAGIFAKQNPRFDHGRFHKAAGSTAHETPKSVKESVLEAVRAKYVRENNLEEVVQKSQMKPGETLGQTMNRLSGKTAIKGGANDPSSPSFKGPKPAATSSSTGGDAGYKSDGGRTVSLKPVAEPGTAQAAEPPKAAPAPAAQPKGWSAPKDVDQSKTVASSGGAAPADKPDTQTPQQRWDASRAATNTPAPGVASKTASAEVASGAAAAKQSSDSVAKLMKMNESVQVGANKYRIV